MLLTSTNNCTKILSEMKIDVKFTHFYLLHICHLLVVTVDGGHRAVIFDRFAGVKNLVVGEGTHFFIPWVQKPIIFDIRSRPRNVPTITGSKGKYSLIILE